MTPAPRSPSRFGLVLAGGQIRYQLLLVLRSPIGTFTTIVIPLMVLIAINVASPRHSDLHDTSYAHFLTPAMATFALLNACYVGPITSVVLAREEGVLKRLHGTPLPLWAYVVGRIAAGAVLGIASVAVVLGVAAAFLSVRPGINQIAELAGVMALGILDFTTVGLAVSTFVPRPETALPVAYGTMLPIAFVSDVFFPASSAPEWLRHTAAALPLAPIADSAERIFTEGGGWPMTSGELLVTLGWIVGASAVTAVRFRWEPGVAFLSRPRPWHGRRGGGSRPEAVTSPE